MMLKTPQTPGGMNGPGKLVRKILVAEDAYAPDETAEVGIGHGPECIGGPRVPPVLGELSVFSLQ